MNQTNGRHICHMKDSHPQCNADLKGKKLGDSRREQIIGQELQGGISVQS